MHKHTYRVFSDLSRMIDQQILFKNRAKALTMMRCLIEKVCYGVSTIESKMLNKYT